MKMILVMRVLLFALPALAGPGLTSCGGEPKSTQDVVLEKAAMNQNQALARHRRVNERLETLEKKMAQLNDEIAKLNTQQDKQMKSLAGSAKSMSDELALARMELDSREIPTVPLVPKVDGPLKLQPVMKESPASSPAKPADEKPGFIVRFLLVLIILGAIWILAKIFLGRIEDDDDFDDDMDFTFDEAGERPDTTYQTDEGMISLSPDVTDAIPDLDSAGRMPGDDRPLR